MATDLARPGAANPVVDCLDCKHYARYDHRTFDAQALKRSRTLLRKYLTRTQWASVLAHRPFLVRGSQGGRYRVSLCTQKVTRVPSRKGYRERYYCVYPAQRYESLPPADVVLTLVTWIKADERYFVREANLM